MFNKLYELWLMAEIIFNLITKSFFSLITGCYFMNDPGSIFCEEQVCKFNEV